tara:strand:- start:1278 stop:1517 length:240 start_codon:yes stop_codon:yes gene_type:complete
MSAKPLKTKVIFKMDNLTINLSIVEAKEMARILEKATAIQATEKTDLKKESDLLGVKRYRTENALHWDLNSVQDDEDLC